MSRTNLHHTCWVHHISTKILEKELLGLLHIDSMNNYIARRQLRCLGHVSRIPFNRLPRRMLSSWLPSPRCRGAAKMTYGRTMKKAKAIFDFNHQNWSELFLLVAESGMQMQWSNDDSFGAVLEDDVSHMHGIHPCTPSLPVLNLFPFSLWWVVESMLRGIGVGINYDYHIIIRHFLLALAQLGTILYTCTTCTSCASSLLPLTSLRVASLELPAVPPVYVGIFRTVQNYQPDYQPDYQLRADNGVSAWLSAELSAWLSAW